MSRWLRNTIVIAVLFVWLLNVVAHFVIDQYEIPPPLNVAFMSLLGAVVYSFRVDEKADKEESDE